MFSNPHHPFPCNKDRHNRNHSNQRLPRFFFSPDISGSLKLPGTFSTEQYNWCPGILHARISCADFLMTKLDDFHWWEAAQISAFRNIQYQVLSRYCTCSKCNIKGWYYTWQRPRLEGWGHQTEAWTRRPAASPHSAGCRPSTRKERKISERVLFCFSGLSWRRGKQEKVIVASFLAHPLSAMSYDLQKFIIIVFAGWLKVPSRRFLERLFDINFKSFEHWETAQQKTIFLKHAQARR